jgi:Cu/Ag efflux protein CusF
MKFKSSLLLALAATLPLIASAQNAPSAEMVLHKDKGSVSGASVVELQGVVTAIDYTRRAVTIRGGSGEIHDFVAGPEIKNFAQVKVGDTVSFTSAQALSLKLIKGGNGIRERTEKEVNAAAKPGEKPGAVEITRVRIVADVTAVDAAAGKITLRGPSRTLVLDVKPALLKNVKVGDQVEAIYVDGAMLDVQAKAK